MSSVHQDHHSRPLRGLDPAKLLDVLDAGGETPPQIPGWSVLGIAGRGGFGLVWRAKRESDGALAAIKIAPASEPDMIERIEGEAVVLRSLDHPNIVALLDSGPLDVPAGGLFLAMRFIDGPELSQEISANGLSPERCYRLFRQIATAVGHAHEAGILHRDLKPANILLAADDHVMVADFGLALPVHRRIHALSLTRAGMIAGTAEYLPPEAYRRDYRPSPATDVFALGVILHELLTGAPPRGAWPAVSSIRAEVDVRVDGVIRRALDPDPTRRWPGVREMLAALEAVLASPPRFEGTPLVTYPVRVADCLWTLLGLTLWLAGTSTVLSLGGARWELPLDLIGDHQRLTGSFIALFIMLMMSLPLSLWQILRLHRFRHIPLREALPSPLGLKLGHHKTAAALVCGGQIFCLISPAYQMLSLYQKSSLTWIKPGDPQWLHGLAVTSWTENKSVSPWRFGPFNENYWLWESFGMPGTPLAQAMERVSFVPFFQPAGMVLAALLLAVALSAVLWVACREWWKRKLCCRAVILMTVVLGASYSTVQSVGKMADDMAERASVGMFNGTMNRIMTSQLRAHARDLLAVNMNRETPMSHAEWTDLYAEMVNYRKHGLVPRSEIPQLLAGDRLQVESVELTDVSETASWNPENGGFTVVITAVEGYELSQSAGAFGADWLKLEMTGTLATDGRTEIQTEVFDRLPIYRTDSRVADRTDISSWLTSLFDAVAIAETNPQASDRMLAPLFHEVSSEVSGILGGPWVLHSPDHRTPWIQLLKPGAFSSERPLAKTISRLSGGRTRVVLPLHTSPSGAERLLHADLIHVSGAWRCIRIAL